jgi:PAS domain S-box-containing protein
MNIQNFLLLLNVGMALFIAGFSLRRSNMASSIHLAVLAFVVAFWSLTYLLFNLQLVPFSKLLFVALVYLFSAIAASALLTFSLVFSNRSGWIRRFTIILLAVEPLLTQLLFWIQPTRELFFLGRVQSSTFISLDSGLWASVNAIYLYNFEIASLLLLTDIFSKKPRRLLFQAGTLLAGAFIPLVFRLLSAAGNGSVDFSIVGYSMAIIGLTIGLYRKRAIEIIPVTYETVVNSMSDGWMVLDLDNTIIDVNPAAEKIVGVARHILYGKPIRSILPDWPNISDNAGEGKELEMRRSIRAHGSWRYLNIRLSNLKGNTGAPFGQLIIWRDITERRLAEEARQRARDEMFVLLNAISNAASHSIKLDDFLSESIFQIIYPFQSQVVAVYLVDEDERDNSNLVLHLASYFGLSTEDAQTLNSISVSTAMIKKVMNIKQPLVVEGTQPAAGIPEAIQQIEMAELVFLPLYTQAGGDSKIVGAMFLGRKEPNPYTQDEVIRLTAITEQIANLIDSDRRRQLAIALSEREKLMRDLHDSVSQKLYGLVTLTEAAQAGLEAGSKVVPSVVLAKIGENARQAVKEMRLFLYQMQPVDLEEGGLISALHHRLGAVEGRADIQARFLPDENIVLSKEKGVALYYIAQEALNNILKHAHASSVLVKLKQTRKNVILEIIDNGAGFDLKNIDQGGMGLQNMKARTAQINGALKIISKPGDGTKIRVTVAREGIPNRAKNR